MHFNPLWICSSSTTAALVFCSISSVFHVINAGIVQSTSFSEEKHSLKSNKLNGKISKVDKAVLLNQWQEQCTTDIWESAQYNPGYAQKVRQAIQQGQTDLFRSYINQGCELGLKNRRMDIVGGMYACRPPCELTYGQDKIAVLLCTHGCAYASTHSPPVALV